MENSVNLKDRKEHLNYNLLFIFSGAFSVLIYVSLIFVLLFNVLYFFNAKKYAPKPNLLSESIVVEIQDSKPSETIKSSGTPTAGLGIKDIFSTIPDEEAKNLQIGDDKSEVAKNTKNKDLAQKLSNLQNQLSEINKESNELKQTLDVKISSNSIEQTSGEYDEWFAKIYDIIYRNWHSNFQQNAKVIVLININRFGKATGKIIQFSGYEAYNLSVSNFLEKLKGLDFPPPPNNKQVSIEVNFITNPKN